MRPHGVLCLLRGVAGALTRGFGACVEKVQINSTCLAADTGKMEMVVGVRGCFRRAGDLLTLLRNLLCYDVPVLDEPVDRQLEERIDACRHVLAVFCVGLRCIEDVWRAERVSAFPGAAMLCCLWLGMAAYASRMIVLG